MSHTRILQFPSHYTLAGFKFINQDENPNIKWTTQENKLIMEAETQDFAGSLLAFELTHALSPSEYDELQSFNSKQFRVETLNYKILYLKMGTFGIISAITAIITASVVIWATKGNFGRVYTEDGEYELTNEIENPENDEISKEIIRRRADISFISYDDVPEDKQDAWNTSFIDVPPSLAIEIVSAKKSLTHELTKMREIWIDRGTKLGLVICPFTKKIYIFEKGKVEYSEQSIFEPFTHSLLPGYEGDFSTFMDKIE